MRFFLSFATLGLLLGYCALVAVGYRPIFVHINRVLLQWLGTDFLQARAAMQHFLPLPELLIYNLPGACWIGLLTWLGLYLGKRLVVPYRFLYLLPLLLGQGMELLQYLQLSDGTFDSMDALLNTIGFFLGFCCYHSAAPREVVQHAKVPTWQFLAFGLLLFSAFLVDV